MAFPRFLFQCFNGPFLGSRLANHWRLPSPQRNGLAGRIVGGEVDTNTSVRRCLLSCSSTRAAAVAILFLRIAGPTWILRGTYKEGGWWLPGAARPFQRSLSWMECPKRDARRGLCGGKGARVVFLQS